MEVASGTGIVVVRDAELELAPVADVDPLLAILEPLARSGKAFFLASDDPVRYRIDVYSGEPPPAQMDRHFEPLGGAFLLEAPTGRIVVSGCELSAHGQASGTTVDVGTGRHLLTLMGRRPFSGARHAEDMIALLGRGEWDFVQRVDRLGLLGCLPLVVALVCALIASWRWLLWYVLPVLALSWLPYLVFKNTRRYKSGERIAAEHEKSMPLFIVTLMPTEQQGLAGGFVRV